MNEFETIILVFCVLVAVAGFVYYKLKQANARIEAMFEEEARMAELSRRIDKRAAEDRERQALRKAFPVETNVIPTSEQIRSFTRPNSGFIQPSRPTSKTVTSTYTSSPRTTVVDNSSDDILTSMILQNALNRQHDVTAGSVSWKDNVPTIQEVEVPAYRAPDPEPTPSYSSSYSSSSSDSSYSSSYSSDSSSSDSSSSSSSD